MSECLITKLKATVNDDSLLYFGKVMAIVEYSENASNDTLFFEVIMSDPIADRGITFPKGGGFGDNQYTLQNGNYLVLVPKYDLTSLSCGLQSKIRAKSLVGATKLETLNLGGLEDDLDLSILEQAPNLRILNLSNARTKVTGNTNSLKNLNLTEIRLFAANNVDGIITDFAKMTNLTFMTLPSSSKESRFGGELLDFVRGQIDAGRTSATIDGGYSAWWGANGLLTFNGTPIKNTTRNTLTWNGGVVTLTCNDESFTANI